MKNASSTNHTDNNVQILNDVYHYKIVAVYNFGKEEECISIPANVENNDVKYILDIDLTDGVSEKDDDAISIYPNPAKDKLNVKGEEIQSVTMFNMVGQVVYHNGESQNNQIIDLGSMPSGIYMVKVNTSGGETVKKVSIVR